MNQAQPNGYPTKDPGNGCTQVDCYNLAKKHTPCACPFGGSCIVQKHGMVPVSVSKKWPFNHGPFGLTTFDQA